MTAILSVRPTAPEIPGASAKPYSHLNLSACARKNKQRRQGRLIEAIRPAAFSGDAAAHKSPALAIQPLPRLREGPAMAGSSRRAGCSLFELKAAF
jgi:hypothetical protein